MVHLCVLLVFALSSGICSDSVTYKMDELCGVKKELALSRSTSALVKFHRNPSLLGIFTEKQTCDFALDTGYWTDDVSWNRLSIEILDFQNQGASCVSFSQVKEKSNWHSAKPVVILGLTNPYCGATPPPINTSLVLEKYSMLVIKFEASSYKEDGEMSFRLAANVFHADGSCSKYQCDNGRCIPYDLRCSDLNPCGDYSHCRADKVSVVTIICIVAGCLAGLILFVFIFKCWRDRRKRKRDEAEEAITNQPSVGNTEQSRNEARQALPLLRTDIATSGIEEPDGGKSPDADDNMPPPSYEEAVLK